MQLLNFDIHTLFLSELHLYSLWRPLEIISCTSFKAFQIETPLVSLSLLSDGTKKTLHLQVSYVGTPPQMREMEANHATGRLCQRYISN